MNAAISASSELALRKHVERAVRPVRAGRDRKLAMREELLAHLTAIYVDELTQQPDGQTAMAAALQRFGEPAALTAELKTAAGFAERYAYYSDCFAHLFSPYRGESLVRFAFRLLLALSLQTSIIFIAAALVDSWGIRIFQDDPTKWPLLPRLCVMLVAGEVATVVAAWSICRALGRDHQLVRWFWAIGLSIVWSVVDLGLVALFWWSITGTLAGFERIAGRAAVWGVAGLAVAYGPLPVLLLLSGWILQAGQKYRQKYEVWTTLAIDE